MDKNRLRSVMVLFGDTSETLANYLGISQSAFSKKINEKSTAGFTQPEIMRIKEKYSLSGEDIDHIFLEAQCPKKTFRKEERMEKKVIETINALCDWVKNELESIDGNDKESIMPEMIEALTELIKAYRSY